MGIVNFGVPKSLVSFLHREFGVPIFIETGTNQAQTTVWASSLFPSVCSIEGFEPLYRKALESYGNIRNIRFIYGDSRVCLPTLCRELETAAVFWLDAHWCGDQTFGLSRECPILDELRAINQSPQDHFILIDDARLFLAPPPPPHNANHWPDLAEVCAAIAGGGPRRYVFIFQDVIVAVPMVHRDRLTAWLKHENGSEREAARMLNKSWPSRRLAQIRTLLG